MKKRKNYGGNSRNQSLGSQLYVFLQRVCLFLGGTVLAYGAAHTLASIAGYELPGFFALLSRQPSIDAPQQQLHGHQPDHQKQQPQALAWVEDSLAAELEKLKQENVALRAALAGSRDRAQFLEFMEKSLLEDNRGNEGKHNMADKRGSGGRKLNGFSDANDNTGKDAGGGADAPSGEQGGGGRVCLPKVESSFFCPPSVADRRDWERRRKDIKWAAAPGAEHRAYYDRADPSYRDTQQPQWMCEKLANPVTPWIEPRTTVNDVVVGVFSGENVFYTRALAARDTWLYQFPAENRFIYAATGDSNLPVVGLASEYPHIKEGDVQSLQLFGLKHMYESRPNQAWYYIVGCDTFIQHDFMLRALDEYDASETIWLTPASWPDEPGFPTGFNTSAWPNWKMGRDKKTFHWSTGAFGWFLSNKAARAYSQALDRFVADPAFPVHCYCPDRLTGMLLSLLGLEPTHLRRKWEHGMLAYAVDSRITAPWLVDENILYHYAQPRKMVAIAQRMAHQKLDRLLNSGDGDDGAGARLVTWIRQFIDDHYDGVRRHQIDVRYLISAAANQSSSGGGVVPGSPKLSKKMGIKYGRGGIDSFHWWDIPQNDSEGIFYSYDIRPYRKNPPHYKPLFFKG